MDILKNELFMLVERNKIIESELNKITSANSRYELKKEYEYNIKCIGIIKEMAGPIIINNWRREWLSKKIVI